MVRKHFTFQLWRNKSKGIIKGTQLKCSSLEHPILKSIYLTALVQKKLNRSLFLQFIQVSFSIIRVRNTGTQCITLSQYPKNCARSPLLPQTPAWVCQLNSSCGNLWKWSEMSRFEYHRFKLKVQEIGGDGNKNDKTKQTLWLGKQWCQKDTQN